MFKKLLSVLLVVALLICNTGTIAFAESVAVYSEQSGEEVTIVASGTIGYKISWHLYSDGELKITGEGYEIPDYTYEGDSPWYAYREQIRTVNINVSSTVSFDIGAYSFAGCVNLVEFKHANIGKIGKRAFYRCTSLEEVFIMNRSLSDVEIGEYAFADCTALKTVSFHQNAKLGDYAFMGCRMLTNIYISSGFLTLDFSVGKGTFNNVVATVFYPKKAIYSGHEGTSTIGGGQITKIGVDYGVCGVNSYWQYDSETATLTISGEGSIAKYSMGQETPWGGYLADIKNIVIESGITEIPDWIFEDCINAEKVSLPNTIEVISPAAFRTNDSLNNLIIPESVKEFVTTRGFAAAMTDLYYLGTEEEWNSIKGVSVTENNYITNEPITVHFLEYHEGIDATCKDEGAEPYYTFEEPSVYDYYYDIDKNKIDAPVVIESKGHDYGEWIIDKEAVAGEEGSRHRICNKCSYTETVSYEMEYLGTGKCGDNLTWTLYTDGTLYIAGTGDMYDYKGFSDDKAPWYSLCNVSDSNITLVMEEGITSIGKDAFWNCKGIKGEVNLPNGITKIGNYAFFNCENITKVIMPNSVMEIGRCAFESCDNLKSVDLPQSIITISYGMFAECSSLSDIKIPKSVTKIEAEAFECCYLYTIVIPENVKEIGNRAFWGNRNGYIMYPSGITLGEEVFEQGPPYVDQKCYEYKLLTPNTAELVKCTVTGITYSNTYLSLYIPKLEGIDIVSVGSGAFDFSEIENLKGIRLDLPTTITKIGVKAFDEKTVFNFGEYNLRLLNDETLEIVSYNNDDSFESGSEFVVPSTILDRKVKVIGANAFSGYNFASVVIPNEVTTIGDGAFAGCEELKNINLPKSVTTIGERAFSSCISLDEINLPDSVETIGAEAFSGCSALKRIIVPSKVKQIDSRTFEECTSLTEVALPEGLEVIKDQAFYYCRSLVDINLPETLTNLGFAAFCGCELLSNISLPDSLETIHPAAFSNTNVKNITIPSNVVYIPEYSFDGCKNLESVLLHSKIEYIAEDAFEDTSVTLYIPYGADHLVKYAEDNDIAYELIDEDVIATGKCGENLIWTIDKDGTLKLSGTGDMYDYGLETPAPWYGYRDKIKSLVLEEGITSIGNYAFAKCDGITGGLVIPESVTKIGNIAFFECSGFTGNLVVPEGVTTIGESAFYDCHGFTGDLIVPDTVKLIGSGAFMGCAGFDGKLILSKNITEIEEYAFLGLEKITGDLVIPNGVTSIGAHAFEMCSFDGKLVIPSSVNTIEEWAFYNCGTLTGEVTIPAGVTFVGTKAFDSFGHYAEGITVNILCAEAAIEEDAFDPDADNLYRIPAEAESLIQYAIDNGLNYELINQEMTGISASGYTGVYDGNAYSITVTAPEEATVTYSTSENGVYSETKPTLTNVGTLIVYYKVEKEGYKTVTGSAVVEITPAGLLGVVADGYTGVYDGESHTVSITAPVGTNVTYATSAGGIYTTEKPSYKEAGTYKVYYKVTKTNYMPMSGFVIVVIEPKSIENVDVSLEYETIVYDGTEKLPIVTIDDPNQEYFEVRYGNAVDAGIVTVTINGIGNYTGTITKTYEIEPAIMDVTAEDYEGVYDDNYHSIKVNAPEGAIIKYATSKNGTYTTSKPTLKNVGTKTVYYKVEKKNYITEAGSATIIIEPKAIDDMEAELEYETILYDGSAKEPNVAVEGLSSSDFEVSYSSNINVGVVTVTITGVGNYTGSITKTFEITPTLLTDANLEYTEVVFNGRSHEPKVSINGLYENTDFTVSYVHNVNAGTAIAIASGIGNYSGSVVKAFTIKPAECVDVSLEYYSKVYTGENLEPNVKVFYINGYAKVEASKDDYTVSYNENLNVGTATITVSGKNNLQGTISKTFEITPARMSVTAENVEKVYNGTPYSVNVAAPEGAKIYYSTNQGEDYVEEKPYFTDAGTYTVCYKVEKPNYKTVAGSVVLTILPGNMDVDVDEYEGIYDGKTHSVNINEPEGAIVTYSLQENGDYISEKPLFTSVGCYTVYYKVEKPNYNILKGSAQVVINPKEITDATLEYESIVYDGTEKNPIVNVVGLIANVDFDIIYDRNVDAGIALVTIKGKGNYTGTITKSFIIEPATMEVTADGYEGEYDGKSHGITVNAPEGAIIFYSEDQDFDSYSSTCPTYEYPNGEGNIVYYKVEKANYKTVIGSARVVIKKAYIGNMDVNLEYESVPYNGEEKFPTVTINGLVHNEDYTVTYSNNVKAGTAIVTIEGQGYYCGTITKTFEITENYTDFAGGVGTEDNPYRISTKEHLANVSKYLDAHFVLLNDITFVEDDYEVGGDFYNDGKGWIPIGTDLYTSFAGSFDGNNHTISGLLITSDMHYVGLFGFVKGEVKDLTVENSTFITTYAAGDTTIGGVVGVLRDGKVTNCHNKSNIKAITNNLSYCAYVGGVVGFLEYGTATNCTNAGMITSTEGSNCIGGIVGRNAEGTVSNCINTGKIDGSAHRIGGVVGYSRGGEIKNCKNTKTLVLDAPKTYSPYIGGIAGDVVDVLVNNCSNSGSISSNAKACNVGGIIGRMARGKVESCRNIGKISANGTEVNIGGIVAYADGGNTVNCYNKGKVSADDKITMYLYVGGISGRVVRHTISSCYNQGDIIAINGQSMDAVGGISGWVDDTTIDSCFNTGNIQALYHMGGVVGNGVSTDVSNCYNTGVIKATSTYNFAGAISGDGINRVTISNCYFLKNSGPANTGAKVLTLDQMKKKSSFAGFDFNNTWTIDSNGEYKMPYLKNVDRPTLTNSDDTQSEGSTRLAGSNRYGTSAEISSGFIADSKANAIVIVDGLGFADALAATPFAASLGAPILMANGPAGILDGSVIAEINRIDPNHNAKIYLIGGEGAVSPKVITKLVSMGYSKSSIDRVAGSNRYTTAIEVAKRMPQAKTAYIAYGLNYPDALGGGSAAALNDGVVLFTSDKKLTAETKSYLKSGNFEKVVILGGTGAVSAAVENELKGMFGSSKVTRAAGKDRFLTSVEIAKKYFAKTDTIVVATGMNFADALAGGPLAAELNAPILLINGTGNTIPREMKDYIKTSGAKNLVVLGGTGAVSDSIMSQIEVSVNN